MKTLAIEGMQWGDEGKGKVTDFCASHADIVVRSQGGNNAGTPLNITESAMRFVYFPPVS